MVALIGGESVDLATRKSRTRPQQTRVMLVPLPEGSMSASSRWNNRCACIQAARALERAAGTIDFPSRYATIPSYTTLVVASTAERYRSSVLYHHFAHGWLWKKGFSIFLFIKCVKCLKLIFLAYYRNFLQAKRTGVL